MPGGRISRDETGELNGELVDRAKGLVKLPRNAEAPLDADYFIAEHKKLNAAGLTSIRYPGARSSSTASSQEMEKKGQLTIRVNAADASAGGDCRAIEGGASPRRDLSRTKATSGCASAASSWASTAGSRAAG